MEGRPKSRAFVDKVLKKQMKNRESFAELVEMGIDDQVEFFMKSFIFALGDNYKDVSKLADAFSKYLSAQNEATDLSPVQAADFLQKNGKTRTAKERQEELADIDLDHNGRICFIEYLLLHYKIMILKEYFKRQGTAPSIDLGNEGIGLTGVGDLLLDELFTMPVGLSEELENAIEDFMTQKKAREAHIKDLKAKADAGGVKGLAAANELAQLNAQDTTEMNKIELTLQAAKRKAEKESPDAILAKKKEEEERKLEEQRKQSRAALAARASAFEKKN